MSLSVLNDVVVALRSLSTTAEFLISLGLLLTLLTLAKAACANKVADFIATFMKKKLASKMQLMCLVALLFPDPLEELTTRTESAFGEKSQKCCMDVLCTWVKLQQICKFRAVNCTKMHLAAGIHPDPLGEL